MQGKMAGSPTEVAGTQEAPSHSGSHTSWVSNELYVFHDVFPKYSKWMIIQSYRRQRRTSAWYLVIVSLYHPSQQPPHNICFEHRKENQPQEADLGAMGRSVSKQLSPLCTEHFSVISFNFRSKATLATVTIVQNMYQTNRTIDSLNDGCQ